MTLYTCPDCGKKYQTKSGRDNHERIRHGDEAIMPEFVPVIVPVVVEPEPEPTKRRRKKYIPKPKAKRDPKRVAAGSKGGKIGGPARLAATTPEERAAIATGAAETRWDYANSYNPTAALERARDAIGALHGADPDGPILDGGTSLKYL